MKLSSSTLVAALAATAATTTTAFSPLVVVDTPLPPSAATAATSITTIASSSATTAIANTLNQDPLTQGITNWLHGHQYQQGQLQLQQRIANAIVPPAFAADTNTTPAKPPTNAEIKLLREAFAALYGERDAEKALGLLSRAIDAWERQPPDERAALYRVRGDCYMELLNPVEAEKDYTITIDLLSGPGGEKADPAELPAALLGRGRAMRSNNANTNAGEKLSPTQYKQVSSDYQISLRLTSREEWDTDEENEADGAARNPYAAWEWGTSLRGSGNVKAAAEVHTLASLAFKDIGDRAHSVISALDAGIDLAGSVSSDDDMKEAKEVLQNAIKSTTSVEGRDVELLQRVIAKESEARMALASLLWSTSEKAAAEVQFGEACGRLDQLQADADAREAARVKSGAMPPVKYRKLPFTIDDIPGAELSCSRFKNEKFVKETLLWPEPLQQKLSNIYNLSK